MENITLIALDERIKDFIAMPAGPLKNLKYKNMVLHTGYDASIVYKDGCMYYGCTTYKVAKGKHSYFLRSGSKDGFTLDAKGKLQIWYGRTVKKLPRVDDVIKAIGNDWYNSDYLPFLTKGILEKILNRKITNPLGFFEAWLKAQHIKASPRLVFKAVSQQNPFTVYSMMLKYQSIFKHMDQFLEVLLDYQGKHNASTIFSSNFIDMLDQAVILEQTVDPYWSGKRIEAEHQRMTQEIMELELENIENTPVEGLDEIRKLLNDNEHITLLDNRRAVFMEGKMMSHCIYTNYWNKIESKSLLCFHVDYRNQQGTLTLQLDRIPHTQTVEYRMYDFKDKYNREPGEHVSQYVRLFINQFNVWMVENKITVPKLSPKHSYAEEPHYLPF
jgi:hypothetical protein